MPVGLLPIQPIFGAMCMQGVDQDGRPILILTAENLDRVQGFTAEIQKDTLERFHLESFRADYVLQMGTPPFDSVRRGPDPNMAPDFVVVNNGAEERLDCAVLADHHRRSSYRLMENLRNRLIQGAGDRDFSGIAGCIVSVWFGESLAEHPPRRSDDSVVEPLLDLLAETRVDREGIARLIQEVAERGFPQVMPPVVATRSTSDGSAGFVANVVANAQAGQAFATGLGFELQLSRPAELTAESAISELRRIVSDHDKPEIEHLLVTAGGPDRAGVRYPGEEVVAAFIAEQEDLSIPADHLRRLTLHLWSARRVVDIALSRT